MNLPSLSPFRPTPPPSHLHPHPLPHLIPLPCHHSHPHPILPNPPTHLSSLSLSLSPSLSPTTSQPPSHAIIHIPLPLSSPFPCHHPHPLPHLTPPLPIYPLAPFSQPPSLSFPKANPSKNQQSKPPKKRKKKEKKRQVMCMCVDHGFSFPVPKQKRWVGGWVGYLTLCIGVQYNSIYIYIYAWDKFRLCRVFFVISFFRLHVEGVFFVNGKCGG